MPRYFGTVFQNLDGPARIDKTEEMLTSALMWLFVDHNIATFTQAEQIASQINLDRLLCDPVMIGQLDMAGRPPFTFSRLITPAHFQFTPEEQKGQYREWIDEIAATALQRDDVDTHYWYASGRKWAVRPTRQEGKRGPEAQVWKNQRVRRESGVGIGARRSAISDDELLSSAEDEPERRSLLSQPRRPRAAADDEPRRPSFSPP